MDDLISRQDAIEALQKHEKSKGHNYSLFVDIVSECAEIIRDVPSAQPERRPYHEEWVSALRTLPEVIRCKDCKYMTEHYDTDGNAPYWTCSEWDSGTDYDGFCHYAERRTDE